MSYLTGHWGKTVGRLLVTILFFQGPSSDQTGGHQGSSPICLPVPSSPAGTRRGRRRRNPSWSHFSHPPPPPSPSSSAEPRTPTPRPTCLAPPPQWSPSSPLSSPSAPSPTPRSPSSRASLPPSLTSCRRHSKGRFHSSHHLLLTVTTK